MPSKRFIVHMDINDFIVLCRANGVDVQTFGTSSGAVPIAADFEITRPEIPKNSEMEEAPFRIGENILVVIDQIQPYGWPKIPVIKEIRQATGMGLADAKMASEGSKNPSCQILLPKEKAVELCTQLRQLGTRFQTFNKGKLF